MASPILVDLATGGAGPETMTATLQLEVVQRLRAKPRDPDYGLLTVLIQVWYEVQDSFKIPASCFFPAPEIDSGCIKLVRKPVPGMSADLAGTFTSVVKTAFSQRRKMMFKLLKAQWPEAKLAAGFTSLGLSQSIRAEEVGPEQFVNLTKILTHETAS